MDNDATQPEAVEEQVDDKAEESKQDGISFESQSELDRFTDKRVSKAIETARAKWEEEAKAREDKAKQLAKMTEAERTKAEQVEREKTLTEREKSLQMREYSIQAKSTLAEAGLPNTDELTELVLSDDVEKTNNNINYLKAVIADAVKSKVDELSKQSTPKDTGSFGSLTGQSFMEMAEKNRVIK